MAEQDIYTLAVVLDRATCTHTTTVARSAGAQWPCSTCAARAVVAAGWLPAARVRADAGEKIARAIRAKRAEEDGRDTDSHWYRTGLTDAEEIAVTITGRGEPDHA